MESISLFILSLTISTLITAFIIKVSQKHNILETVRDDRWHKTPTPKLGGVAIFAGIFFCLYYYSFGNYELSALFMAIIMIFCLGVYDDIHGVNPQVKFISQVAIALFLVAVDVKLRYFNLDILNILLSVFWVIGISNAFNLLDNIDGLSGTIALVSSFSLSVFFLFTGQDGLMIVSLILAGSISGFLFFNFKNAKIFMGDSGSLMIGLFISVLGIFYTNHSEATVINLLIPVLLVAIPIFDTTFVTVARSIRGISIMQGGRDHISHRLIYLGFSDTKAVVVLGVLSIFFTAVAIVTYFIGNNIFLFFVILGAFLLLYQFAIFLCDREVEVKEYAENKVKPLIVGGNVKRKKIIEIFTDIILISFSLYLANVIRFSWTLDPHIQFEFLNSLTWIIVIKLTVFYSMGIYTKVWEYVDKEGIILLIKSISLSALLMIGGITMTINFVNYSRSVIIIDWFLLLIFMIGSRVLLRTIRKFIIDIMLRQNRTFIVSNRFDEKTFSQLEKKNKNYRFLGIISEDDNYHNIGVVENIEHLLKSHYVESLFVDSMGITAKTKEIINHLANNNRLKVVYFE
ncbi:MAG: hypothetical protein HQK84_01805 [Nitrospinae bacterium]|nr:hypothetical protein [Nitrospinota bacterium]